MEYKSLINKDASIHCTIYRPRTRFSRHNFANGTNYRLRIVRYYGLLKYTSTLFSLSDHDILSREWGVIVDQVQTNYCGIQKKKHSRTNENVGI